MSLSDQAKAFHDDVESLLAVLTLRAHERDTREAWMAVSAAKAALYDLWGMFAALALDEEAD